MPYFLRHVGNYLFQEEKFSRNKIGINISYDGCKLLLTTPGAWKVIIGSVPPDRCDIPDFLLEKYNHLQ